MDDFGDRMKLYEGLAESRLIPKLPVIIRLDGKCFSSFTRGLERPYDVRMSQLMVNTARFLCEEFNACCGYTQSDEITLALYNPDGPVIFDGRIQKIASIFAAKGSAFFNKHIDILPSTHKDKLPIFDCRVWNVPDFEEGANAFLWREQDATKNAISMAAHTYYSHNELHKKHGNEMQEMLFRKGINFNDYPTFFKRGTFISKRKELRKFTAEELKNLPEKHNARSNSDLMVERTMFYYVDMPPFSKVRNRSRFVFFGDDPVCESGLKT